jgi:hypothetical protein
MKNTSGLYFNDYKITSRVPSSASVSSRLSTILGHVVSPEAIAVDPSKVKEALEWKPPTTVSKV